jgi:hypothetical protein
MRRLALAALVLLVWGSRARAQSVCQGVSPVETTRVARVPVVTGLLHYPALVVAPPGDTSRIFVVELEGHIQVKRRGDPPHLYTTFMDMSGSVMFGGERGLLGFAFDPDFERNGTFYVAHSRAFVGTKLVSRYRTFDGDPDNMGDLSSETVLMEIENNFQNHNGGHLAFGPDGYLYHATGDGGGGGDPWGPCGNGQNRSVLLGKILRIDPRSASGLAPDCALMPGPYTIPPDNPFADGPGGECDEIWSYGLRNPWRFDFDPANGDLYIGDVGQNCWEEINYAASASHCLTGASRGAPCASDDDCPGSRCGPGGENYGWRQMEGAHCFDFTGCDPSSAADCSPPCMDPSLQLPVHDYPHVTGCASVTGGLVYRGCRMPQLAGTYFFGDYCEGTVHSLEMVGGVATGLQDWTEELGAGLEASLSSFGRDAQGEIYVTDLDGVVYKLVPPLSDMEVSGLGTSAPFHLADPWTWEDLHYASDHPVHSYRVYRADVLDGVYGAGEVFHCVHEGLAPSWPPAGDPALPPPGKLFAYVITAVNPEGEESSPGGNPEHLLTTSPCPPL